ncbi:hypothetical protein PV646_04595 [Streptomyces sp. ID05-26A]|nr:hypothetical protein [Streptomyces sp. ID05-26A]
MAPVVKPAVPTPNAHYPGQQHEQMKAQVTQNYVPDTATAVSDTWKTIGSTFKDLATDFGILVNGSQDAWQGRAAEGVRAALGKVGTFSEQTGDAFMRTSDAIAQQRDAAVQANRSMPEPVKFSPMDTLKKFAVPAVIFPPAMVGAPFEMMAQHSAQQEAKAEAVQVMQTRDNTMMAAAMSMPAMESTPQVTQDQGVTQTSSSTSSQSLSNVNANQHFSNNSGVPSMPSSSNNGNGTTNTAWTAPQVKDPSLQPGGNNNQNNPGGQNRPPFTPPGMLPPGMRPPGGGQNGRPGGGGPGMRPGGGPGGGGAGGGRGMGPGGMAGVGGSGRGMGSFGPATPGGSAGVAGGPGGAAGTAAGAAGRGGAGAGGMGAGGGAGAGQGGEEDKEHKSNYLLPTDEFFDDDRMVAPPVIGG